jgi:hypothetical protein
MDLNELYRQHQVALINADANGSADSGHSVCLVKHYATRIAKLREEMGATTGQTV